MAKPVRALLALGAVVLALPLAASAGSAYAGDTTGTATITTVVTDALTGDPVPNACVAVVAGPGTVLPDGLPYCSDGQGNVDIGPLAPGTYEIYVSGPDPYGAQWVGPSGGVGTVDQARRTTVKAGQTLPVPAIRLDQAGIVTGTVTDSSGAPLPNALVSISPTSAGVGTTGPAALTDANGNYTFTGLGPYAWPLFFTADGQASQWSGGVANREDAHLVQLASDATVTFDAALAAGITVSGAVRISDDTPAGAGLFSFYNAGSGDPVGLTQVADDGTYQVMVLGLQTVKVQYLPFTGAFVPVWYGGTDFEHATKVDVDTKNLALNIILS